MALARIISQSRRYSQELALDLLQRGYAVEILSPDATSENVADLEFRVESDPDLLSGTVKVHHGDHSASMDFAYRLKDRMVDVQKTSSTGTQSASFSAAGLTITPEHNVPPVLQTTVPLDVQQVVASKLAEQQAKLLELPVVDYRPAPLPTPEPMPTLNDAACPIPLPVQLASVPMQPEPSPPTPMAVGQIVPLSSALPLPLSDERGVAPNPAVILPFNLDRTVAAKVAECEVKHVEVPAVEDRLTPVPPKPEPRPARVETVCPIPPPPIVPAAFTWSQHSPKAPAAGAIPKATRTQKSTKPVHRSTGWFWPASAIFTAVTLAALVIGFGVRHGGTAAGANSFGLPASEHLLTPALGPVLDGGHGQADRLTAQKPKTSSSRSAQKNSRSHGEDYVAPNTITYLDRPGAKPISVEASTHRRGRSHQRGGVVAANTVTYLNGKAAPKAESGK